MWPIPDKYKTQCYLNETNSLISEHIFEAINKNEAEARALLNCVIENNKKKNVHVSVEKV